MIPYSFSSATVPCRQYMYKWYIILSCRKYLSLLKYGIQHCDAESIHVVRTTPLSSSVLSGVFKHQFENCSIGTLFTPFQYFSLAASVCTGQSTFVTCISTLSSLHLPSNASEEDLFHCFYDVLQTSLGSYKQLYSQNQEVTKYYTCFVSPAILNSTGLWKHSFPFEQHVLAVVRTQIFQDTRQERLLGWICFWNLGPIHSLLYINHCRFFD